MEDRSSRWVIEEEVESETPKPEWFENAVGMAPTSHRVTVEDCPIHYLRSVSYTHLTLPTIYSV